MSFLKFWKSFFLPIQFGFGGGGGGSPSQTTQYSTNIPEYARPYVENMLGATQAQLFTTGKTGVGGYDAQGNAVEGGGYDAQGNPQAGTTTITGFKPYQPYSTNVNDYFAGPSPMQQQSYQGMANMQVAPQVGEASKMAGVGGAGLLGTTQGAGQYGAMGAGLGMQGLGLGMQAAGAGDRYAQMATTPSSVAAYMSPYMQNVVDYQKGQALRDYQIASPMRAAKSIGAGAFGGNRAALETAEAQRGLMSQLQGIEAAGAQNAFQQAQQAQQYGANLGLQGLQTGLQGVSSGLQGAQLGLQGIGAQQAGYSGALNAAGTLGQLGQTQYGQQMGILQGQNQFGQQQQQLEQAKINQAISDYATAQQYPMLQLGLMSNMLRGLPMQAQTTQMYQAAPGYMQQGIGAIGSLASLYGAGRKEGGVVGYKYGGAIPGPKLEGMADKLDIPQLMQRLKDPQLDKGEREIFEDALNNKAKEKARYAGIAAAGGGLFESQGYAGGGIIAFADEGLVPSPEEMVGQTSSPGYGFSVSSLGDVLGMLGTENEWQKAERLKRHGIVYEPPEGYDKKGLPIKKETAAKEEAKTEAKAEAAATPTAAANAAPAKAAGVPGAQLFSSNMPDMTRMGALNQRQEMLKAVGINPEGGEKTSALMKLLEEQGSNLPKTFDQDRKLRMAQAFAEFGSTFAPGGMGQAGLKSLGTYAKGEAEARKAEQIAITENAKAQSALEEGRRREKIGDVDAAEKAFQAYEGHKVSRDNAITQANAHIQAAQIGASASNKAGVLKAEQMAAIKAEWEAKHPGQKMSTEDLLRAYTRATTTADESIDSRIRLAAQKELSAWNPMLDPSVPKDLLKRANKGDKAAIAEFNKIRQDKFNEILKNMTAAAGSAGAPMETVTNPTYSKGQTVDYNGKTYRFKGGDQYDRSNWEAV